MCGGAGSQVGCVAGRGVRLDMWRGEGSQGGREVGSRAGCEARSQGGREAGRGASLDVGLGWGS